MGIFSFYFLLRFAFTFYTRNLQKQPNRACYQKVCTQINTNFLCVVRGVTALTRAVSGEKQIYSGNLEILPGIGKPRKFFGKYEIFLGHWAKIWYYMLSNNIYTVICTLFMRCILCILTLNNGLTPHDMKRPISNVSTFPTKIAWSLSAIDHVQSPADWHKNRTGARHILSVHTRSHHSLVQGYFYTAC